MQLPPESHPDPSREEPKLPLEIHRAHVLIAEDDDDFRHLLTSALRADGYLVTAVSGGAALLRALSGPPAEEPLSLVISDERMPEIRGLQVFRQARDLGMTLPLVLITAFGDDELIAKAAQIGVVVIRKPFEIEDLRIVARFLTAPSRRRPGQVWNVGSTGADNPMWKECSLPLSVSHAAKRDTDAEGN